MHFLLLKKQCFVLGLLFASSLLLQGQSRLHLGAGVSDIGFLYRGESVYFGYDLHSLEHSIPSFSYYISASQTFMQGKRIQPRLELQFSREGLNYSQRFLFDHIKYQVKIHYLKVPLLLHLDLVGKRERSLGFDLGPYASYRISAVRDLTLEGTGERRTVENVNPLDAGIIMGASFGIIRTPLPLEAGFRISYSLVNMMSPIDESIRLYYGPEKEYARNITLMFTVSTLLSRKR